MASLVLALRVLSRTHADLFGDRSGQWWLPSDRDAKLKDASTAPWSRSIAAKCVSNGGGGGLVWGKIVGIRELVHEERYCRTLIWLNRLGLTAQRLRVRDLRGQFFRRIRVDNVLDPKVTGRVHGRVCHLLRVASRGTG